MLGLLRLVPDVCISVSYRYCLTILSFSIYCEPVQLYGIILGLERTNHPPKSIHMNTCPKNRQQCNTTHVSM